MRSEEADGRVPSQQPKMALTACVSVASARPSVQRVPALRPGASSPKALRVVAAANKKQTQARSPLLGQAEFVVSIHSLGINACLDAHISGVRGASPHTMSVEEKIFTW